MLYTIKRAIESYKDDKVWSGLMSRGMDCDFSWDNSAIKYVELYEKICE
jgi:starch synthase